ncbi:hypothetical protein B0A52_00648 [Exophiala mesophila]|uniref:Zn(2)-C6 fungal-type domain-containing protein n=1 Tax=Exophiala mesophila TaxID=212818 RepID=A0A438NHT7_EXOME|nr:hypothetical protein B0A52_00648 [Exophiala mesophila]
MANTSAKAGKPGFPRGKQGRPISCYLCRLRKLRCSREHPCSNCNTRGIKCSLYGGDDDESFPPSGSSAPSHASPVVEARNTDASLFSDILERLERLENVLSTQTALLKNSDPSHTHRHSHEWQTNTSPVSTNPIQSPRQPIYHHLAGDVKRLEQVSTSHPSKNFTSLGTIVFRVRPPPPSTGPKTSEHTFHSSGGQNSDQLVFGIWLPCRSEAESLVEQYLNNVSYIHHIVHPPRVRNEVRKLYTDLESQCQPDLGSAILFLSLLASVTYLLDTEDSDTELSPAATEASDETLSWIRITLTVLNQFQSSNLCSLQSLQAIIITSFLVGNIEGIAQRFRTLIATALAMARELGLHRIDHGEGNGTTEPPAQNMVDVEVGRRVWWHLTATDWLLTRYSGPAAGVYTVHLNHMTVKKPQNIDDDDLHVDGLARNKAVSVPTAMSYFLQRIRLAEICRKAVDHASLWSANLRGANYSNIVFIDTELTVFSNALPWFFALDNEGSDRFSQLTSQQESTIKVQRYLINTTLHTQRCVLHLPYFARCRETCAYAYSRDVCLDAARSIVQAELLIERDMLPFTKVRLKLSASLYGLFVANIIFFLEASFHKVSEWPNSLRSTTKEAFRLLMEAKRSSSMAAKLCETLCHISEKNKVSLPILHAPNSPSGYPSAFAAGALEDMNNSYGVVEGRGQNQFSLNDWADSYSSCEGQDLFDPLAWAQSIGAFEEYQYL